MNKVIVPISGGMDSCVLLYYAKFVAKFDEIYTLTFNYGQRHINELEFAKYHCLKLGIKEHKVIDVSFIKELTTNSSLTNKDLKIPVQKEIQGHPQHSAHVNCRNLMFLSIASSWAESVGVNTIYHGSAEIDSLAGHWDGSQPFISNLNQLLSLNRLHRINVEAPLMFKSKKDIIQIGLNLGVDFNKTWTCYNPEPIFEKKTFTCEDDRIIHSTTSLERVGYKACGICPSCSARIKGFIDAKIKDPLQYNIEILWYKYGIS